MSGGGLMRRVSSTTALEKKMKRSALVVVRAAVGAIERGAVEVFVAPDEEELHAIRRRCIQDLGGHAPVAHRHGDLHAGGADFEARVVAAARGSTEGRRSLRGRAPRAWRGGLRARRRARRSCASGENSLAAKTILMGRRNQGESRERQ